jgi:hypothetical protein
MQRYIEACAAHDNARRLVALLDGIIPDSGLHARFVNTLSRLEYVGVRKMLKSRRADRLDLDGLQHVLDEAVHALRLKKAAVMLAAATGADVVTFSSAHTLAGDAGEEYFQTLDRRAELAVADLEPDGRAEANYLLTSAAIEVRAQVFYPLYDRRLAAHRAGFSVAAITKDEDRHLGEMRQGLARGMGDWRRRLEPVLAAEEELFARFLDGMEAAAAVARAA